MQRSEVLQKLAAHKDDLIRMGVKTLAVFGSVARDEARTDSDVDILVEFQGPATFNGYMDLKFFLEDLVGRPVDLVYLEYVHAYCRKLSCYPKNPSFD